MATVSPVIVTSSTASPSSAVTIDQPKRERLFDRTLGNYRQEQVDRQAKNGKSMPRVAKRSVPEKEMSGRHHSVVKNTLNKANSDRVDSSRSKQNNSVSTQNSSSAKDSGESDNAKTAVSVKSESSTTSRHQLSASKVQDGKSDDDDHQASDKSKQSEKSKSAVEQLLTHLQKSQSASSKMKTNGETQSSKIEDDGQSTNGKHPILSDDGSESAKKGDGKEEKTAQDGKHVSLSVKQAEEIAAALMAKSGHAVVDEKEEKTAQDGKHVSLSAKQAEEMAAALMAKSGHAKVDKKDGKTTHITQASQDKSHKDKKHHDAADGDAVTITTLTMVDLVPPSHDTKKTSKGSSAENADSHSKKHLAKVSVEQKVQAQISHSDHKGSKVIAEPGQVDPHGQTKVAKEHLSGQLLATKHEPAPKSSGQLRDDLVSLQGANKASKDTSPELNRVIASHVASANKSDGLPSQPSSIAQSVHHSMNQQSTSSLDRQINSSADALQSQMSHKESQGIQSMVHAANTHHESGNQVSKEHAAASISAPNGQTHDQSGGLGGQSGQSMGQNMGQSGASSTTSTANTARTDSSLGNLSMNNNPNLSQELNERVNYMVSHKLQSADIRLDPAHLGTMQIRLNLHHDQAQLQIHVHNPQARDMLEQTMPKLRELLAQQGIQLGQSQISHQQSGQQGGQSGGQGFFQSNDSRSFTGGFGNSLSSEPELDEITSRPVYHATRVDDGIDYYA
ncbi:MAG: hypothetical protein CENE_00328 [Candidatus Celerinatantimonas neptuna]|nr:MAG: hypothetical protein CENE_00328 [Candidatus Celerinatantimonas neptuna]